MLKKNILIIFSTLFIFSICSNVTLAIWNCTYNRNGDIGSSIGGCVNSTSLVQAWDLSLERWFKDQINNWTYKIAWFLGLMAVFAIAYGWFMMTISAWEEEKIKKWKDIAKWGALWFLWIVSASALISFIISFVYSVTWTG